MARNKTSVSASTNNGQHPEDEFPFGANAPEGAVEPAELPEEPEVPDPFDPASLRISPDMVAAAGVKKVLLTVPVRKPGRSEFIRAHPDENFRLQTGIIEVEDEFNEIYIVAPSIREDVATITTLKPKLLVASITRQGSLFIWHVNMPRADGRVDSWTRSALEALKYATTSWVRVTPNMDLRGYEIAQATAALPAPEWPDLTFKEILRIAFRDRMIDTLDHPVLRRLRGEV
jgi:hypothetical protein